MPEVPLRGRRRDVRGTGGPYGARVPSDTSISDTLRLARDLCLGVGAFFVRETGAVVTSTSDVASPEQHEERIAALAHSSLTHPAARGRTLFWNAEVDEESAGPFLDTSLACVVAPVWSGAAWTGLLGVVDTWLPELDEEQRDGLLALASQLGAQLGGAEGRPAAPAPARRGAGEPPSGTGPVTPPPAGTPAAGEPFLGEVLDHLPDGLFVTRADGAIVLANQTFASITGLSVDAVLGEDVSAVIHPSAADLDAVELGGWRRAGVQDEARTALLRRVLANPEPGHQVRVGGEGGVVELEAAGSSVASRFAGDCFVTLVRAAREPGSTEPGSFAIQTLLDHIEDGIVCCDAAGAVVVANRAARRLQGFAEEELVVGEQLPGSPHLRNEDGTPLAGDEHPLVRAMRERFPVSADLLLEGPEGRLRVAVSARPLRVDGGEGAIAVLRDVTAEREHQQNLTHFALHDPLTGVANRYLLHDAVSRMLDALGRKSGFVSLIYLDLDGFKAVNDEHGHDVGDEVLRAVARRLERAVRAEDVVARLGGDEFVVAHATANRLSDGDAVVARIRKALSAPYRVGDLVLDVGASIGWVTTASGAESPDSLMTRADRAMYGHKHARREEVRV